jgi:hypothetical protein
MRSNLFKLTFSFASALLMGQDSIRENHLQEWVNRYQKNTNGTISPLSLTGKIIRIDGSPFLSFKLINISNKTITLWPFELPWGNNNSISVVGITSTGRLIQNIYPISDPFGQSKISIKPGSMLQGKFNLNLAFEIFEQEKSQDILVLWQYRLPKLSNSVTYTGVAVLPAKK